MNASMNDCGAAFPGHDCQSARYAGLSGLKNGDLLRAAANAGFDVLITVDQSMPFQQNLSARGLAILILVCPTNRLRDLEHVTPRALKALSQISPGQVLRVSA